MSDTNRKPSPCNHLFQPLIGMSIQKITRFEYWPFWILYLPVFIQYLVLSIRSRSLAFFAAANPLMFLGGLVGESKISILKTIPSNLLPQSIYFEKPPTFSEAAEAIAKHHISFPFVIKPDVGERGKGVAVMNNMTELQTYLKQYQTACIIQSFLEEPLEFGVLYYRLPDGSASGITSIVAKAFLSITGDGQQTIEQLIRQSERAQLQLETLLRKFDEVKSNILPDGEQMLLEPIGNHCRGTRFIDANALITPQMVASFDQIASRIDGFFIGRFDVKAASVEDLEQGNIKIMELNGIASEPGHIYDPRTPLYKAYAALFNHYRWVYRIAAQNRQLGVSLPKFKTVIRQLRIYSQQT